METTKESANNTPHTDRIKLRESSRRFGLRQGVFGDGPKTSTWWLKLAGLLAFFAFIGQAVGYPGTSVGADDFSRIAVMVIQNIAWLLVVVSFATIFIGLLAAIIQAYLNGNLGVSLILAVAPEVGFAIASPIADRLLLIIDPKTWALSEGSPLLWIAIGVTALIIGFAGFLLGTGAYRVSERL